MATVPTLGFIGEQMDLLIEQGADFGPYMFVMKNPNNTFVNLTGMTIRGQIRKTSRSPTLVQIVCSITNPTQGEYEIHIPNTVTETIRTGETINLPESQYIWDLEMIDTLGKIFPLYYGTVRVHRQVTHG